MPDHPTTDEERVAKALCAADSGDKYGWPYGEMARAAIAALGPQLTLDNREDRIRLIREAIAGNVDDDARAVTVELLLPKLLGPQLTVEEARAVLLMDEDVTRAVLAPRLSGMAKLSLIAQGEKP